MKRIIDGKTLRFLAVGVLNTVVMFALYNLLHLSYWVSSTANYIVGSVVSFIVNKRFTFKNKESVVRTAPRFAVNIAACYFVAYGMARPAARLVLRSASRSVRDNAAMLCGLVLFTALNYAGQRYFVFKEKAGR